MKLIDKILLKYGYSKKLPQEDYTEQHIFYSIYEPTKAYASVNFPCTVEELEIHAKEQGKTVDEFVRQRLAINFLEYIGDCLEYELVDIGGFGAETTQATATLMVWRRDKKND